MVKIAVRAKTRKRFKKLTEKYWLGGEYDAWDTHITTSCVDIKDGCFGHKKFFKENGYKILSWKEWKKIVKL